MSGIWGTGPEPRTHYLIPREGSAKCGYSLEPFEIAEQDFTGDPTQVTCPPCKMALSREVEAKLSGPPRFFPRAPSDGPEDD